MEIRAPCWNLFSPAWGSHSGHKARHTALSQQGHLACPNTFILVVIFCFVF